MSVKVIDASAIAALIFGEPESDVMAHRMSHADLAAPSLLPFEIANVCLMKMRRHPDMRDTLLSAFSLFERMFIRIVEVDHVETIAFAETFSLTAYDASYLWLAHQLDAELITLDQKLKAADTSMRQRVVPE